jgi:hypothetical protein
VENGVAAEGHPPRMDPPNVLWFFGAFALELGVYGLIETLPENQSGLWLLVTAVAFFVGFALASALLVRRAWWVPGGLAAALAVGVFPAVAVSFLTLIDVWPSDSLFEPFDEFSGWTFGVGLATALVGLVAWWFTRFSFAVAVGLGAILVSAQLLTPCFDESPSGDERAATALVIGAILFVVGVFVDVFGRRREAFWFEVLGLFSVAAGLVYLTAAPGGDPDRGWIPMLIGGVFLLVAAGPVRRASWAVYGVLGVYAAVVHYLTTRLDEQHWPFAVSLIVLALAIFAAGMAEHRYGRAWAQRFVRRPPPELSP